jgi:hypothetical protein
MTWPSIVRRSAPTTACSDDRRHPAGDGRGGSRAALQPGDIVQQIVGEVRRRWIHRAALVAFAQAAAGIAGVWLVTAAFARATHHGLLPLVLFTTALAVSIAWCVLVLRRRPRTPTLRDTARFIEEHQPGLDDRLVTAVDVLGRSEAAGPLRELMIADAARGVAGTLPDDIVPSTRIRNARALALAAAIALLVAAALWITPGRRAWSAALMQLMPGRFVLDVTPGDARLRPGTPLTIHVKTTAASTGAIPQLTLRDGDRSRTVSMRPQGDAFVWRDDAVARGFTYDVAVAGRRSPTYRVTMLEPPRVQRIDLQYEFPKYTGLPNRTEEDGGDIYAPNGTRVTLAIKPSHAVTEGSLVMKDDSRVPLEPGPDGRWQARLDVAQDDAYRVALTDGDGLASPGETEYFVRVLDDRPPDVRILRPAGDRQATPLEEVTIEARADDDYGIASFDLVYSVRGGKEQAVPLPGERSGLTATGRQTLFLEDLKVEPGDFVTYYARVRDTGRGKRSTEARSDIYFIEITPFDQQFAAAQSQAMAGAAGNRSLDDLVTTQKEIIVATWKLDRRSAAGRSAQDVRAVGRAQGELRQRAERAVSPLRDPRRRLRNPIGSASRSIDDAMTGAVAAMARAEASLEQVDTKGALPQEMEALNQLLRAQAEDTRREVMRQQAGGGGGGSNRSQADLSTLFDRELQRQQETNYETPPSSQDQAQGPDNGVLEKLKELANRQEQLARQQEDLARDRQAMSAEELKRRLERLTREQSELRRQAESLAQEMARQRREGAQPQQAGASQGQRGERSSGGDPQAASQALREASEEMRGAASDLRRDDPSQASKRSARALDRLRATEQQMQASSPDDRRRALGDLQLEARQLAERQRAVAEQSHTAGRDADARRRAAGEQERLAERAGRLGRQVGQLAERGSGREREQVSEAARDLAGQRIEERMRQAAERMRSAAGEQAASGSPEERENASPQTGDRQAAGGAESEDARAIARALDRVADRLGAAASGQSSEDGRLAEQAARAGDLRQRLGDLRRQIEQLERESKAEGNQQRSAQQAQNGQKSGSSAGSSNGEPSADARVGREQRRQALEQQYREALEEASRLQREAASNGRQGRGAAGGTPEGQQMSLSAPGTEAFKQDFSAWDSLHKDVTLRLERLEASLSQKLLEKAAKDRMRSGAADRAPDRYQRAVDDYFRSLASRP